MATKKILISPEDFVKRVELVCESFTNNESLDEISRRNLLNRDILRNFTSRCIPPVLTDLSETALFVSLNWLVELSNKYSRIRWKEIINEDGNKYFDNINPVRINQLIGATNNLVKYIDYINDAKKFLFMWRGLRHRRNPAYKIPDSYPDLFGKLSDMLEHESMKDESKLEDTPKKPVFIELNSHEVNEVNEITNKELSTDEAIENKDVGRALREPMVYIKVESDLLNFEVEKNMTNEGLGIFIKYMLEKM